MEFKHISLKEFSKEFNIEVKPQKYMGDLIDVLTRAIENSGILEFFSASFNKDDVLDDIEYESETVQYLDLELLEVEGVYLAIY